MKLLFIADARSPIARAWIRYFIGRGHEVHIISTYPCEPQDLPGSRIYHCPIAFSSFVDEATKGTVRTPLRQSLLRAGLTRLRRGKFAGLLMAARSWVGPVELYRYIRKARGLTLRIMPDLVHAMRIPFEGMLAAKSTPARLPLLISIWGNDLTLFAKRNPLLARQTKEVLRRADALHCDCDRDLELAVRSWGFQGSKPHIALPSSGGIQSTRFNAAASTSMLRKQLNISDCVAVVINPRGMRGYVRNDVFFQAIPLVLRTYPQTVFLCNAMQGNAVAEKWLSKLKIEGNVQLLPTVPHDEMAEMFRLASIAVSPSLHDGTPNTLLEAMACGCFPVAGDIESVREWITCGVNGLLCDPTSPESLASSIVRALGDEQMRNRARDQNLRLIAERADYAKVMEQAEEFYFRMILERKEPVRV